MTSSDTLAKLEILHRKRNRIFGNKVNRGVILVDNRQDWRVDYELVTGDPNAPLLVLVNGFVWPRENWSAFMGAALNAASSGATRYNILRYDMSGQGRTMALYKEGETPPWFMSEELTLDKLRKEMTSVVKGALSKHGLPASQPLILVGLSYGRALLDPALAAQAIAIVEVAGMTRSIDNHLPFAVAWRGLLSTIRLSPALAPVADKMQAAAWRDYYRTFYENNPKRVPPGAVRDWYVEAGAMRTKAVSEYDASTHILEGIPTLVLVAEQDGRQFKRDQITYFKDHLSTKSPSALIYVRNRSHGVVAYPEVSNMIIAMIDAIQSMTSTAIPVENRVFEVIETPTGLDLKASSLAKIQSEL